MHMKAREGVEPDGAGIRDFQTQALTEARSSGRSA